MNIAHVPTHRVVIVGGGAAGLELATSLGNRWRGKGRISVILVDRSRTHLWKPLLHAVAAGSLRRSQHELSYLAQAHWHGFSYRYGELIGLDRAAHTVRLAATFDEDGREITPEHDLPYDTLVLAIGSVTNDFGTKGAAEFAVPLETPEQAGRFHRRLMNACLRAQGQTAKVWPGQLHVAIIGAGATGTELSAELSHTARSIIAHGLDRIDPARDLKIILIEATPRILPALPERIAAATRARLNEIGVTVMTGAKVAEVTKDGVVLSDGELIPSELVVWSAGVKAPTVLAGIGGLESNRINQLVVKRSLQSTRDDDVFAIGDCAACPRPGFEQPVPPRAQAAHQMAEFMVGQIEARLKGRGLAEFTYRDFGSLVSLGKFSTVGSLMGGILGKGLFLEGWFARMVYKSLYTMHQAALHGRRSMISRLFSRGGPSPPVKLH